MLNHDTPPESEQSEIHRTPPPYLRRIHRRPVAGSVPLPWWRSPFKAMAIVAWIAACYTTWQAFVSVGISHVAVLIVATLGLQCFLTVLESPVWNGEWYQPVPLAAVIIDTIINAGGMWWVVERLDRLPFWQNVIESFQLSPGMRPIPVLVIAILSGIILAAAPEYLWRK